MQSEERDVGFDSPPECVPKVHFYLWMIKTPLLSENSVVGMFYFNATYRLSSSISPDTYNTSRTRNGTTTTNDTAQLQDGWWAFKDLQECKYRDDAGRKKGPGRDSSATLKAATKMGRRKKDTLWCQCTEESFPRSGLVSVIELRALGSLVQHASRDTGLAEEVPVPLIAPRSRYTRMCSSIAAMRSQAQAQQVATGSPLPSLDMRRGRSSYRLEALSPSAAPNDILWLPTSFLRRLIAGIDRLTEASTDPLDVELPKFGVLPLKSPRFRVEVYQLPTTLANLSCP
ncbi:hypothetical protein BKA70DRAFT_1224682 [Coprinopsis sp. MPI-PUGE-AT-0042]|nr:hypothetical protein BKA70DRAFT_1224682 [Coprinopsis sp. MPI-PUGE-AT-0042]